MGRSPVDEFGELHMSDALVIERLRAEVERLRADNEVLRERSGLVLDDVERLRERVKALEALVAATPYRSPDAPLTSG